jgi:hypothetical protein
VYNPGWQTHRNVRCMKKSNLHAKQQRRKLAVK